MKETTTIQQDPGILTVSNRKMYTNYENNLQAQISCIYKLSKKFYAQKSFDALLKR